MYRLSDSRIKSDRVRCSFVAIKSICSSIAGGNAINTFNSVSGAFGQSPRVLPFETPQQKAARETARVSNEFGANVMFTLKYCEFDSDKSTAAFSTVNMAATEAASQADMFRRMSEQARDT